MKGVILLRVAKIRCITMLQRLCQCLRIYTLLYCSASDNVRKINVLNNSWYICVCWYCRWQRRTQVLSPALQNKFKAVNQGVWAQVAASMADKVSSTTLQ
jgi:hypothetical protein